ncbi:unnamed protein product [Arabidopsis lyrata]|uniref:F-box domain-containing protein n=1 Tax=Arabidopsis lyrata subsp. lyrata TaxID=81972 RepID=D7KV02_ARALL|nr:hypothetical protein ARALYDRAFT_894444 [Arabidopsis lyrata subsp. lyrata]CAH8257323.1 unnamed protein product [Arabidopsis lyrata]
MNDSEEKTCYDNPKQPIIVVDLVRLILERLSFVDFHRARCVSSTWYIASKSVTGVTNPTTPWIILFPNKHVENNNNVSCKLFDLHENKTYIIRDTAYGLDMAKA